MSNEKEVYRDPYEDRIFKHTEPLQLTAATIRCY